MRFIRHLSDVAERLADASALDVDDALLPSAVRGLSDDDVRALLDDVSSVCRAAQTMQALLAGVVAQRSARGAGHDGLASRGGFRTPAEMIRIVAGVSKGEATRAVKVGEALLAGSVEGAGPEGSSGPEGSVGSVTGSAGDAEVWHAPLRDALLAGRLTPAQHDAIYHGLGAPRDETSEARAAWAAAGASLVEDAPTSTVEQLRDHARTLRDLLDEEGAQERLRAHFEARSLRTWRDANGRRRGDIVFDPEMGEWFESLFGAALRPRRGGPRFVAEGEKEAAAALTDDTRTNEQLAYDLLVDVLRAGALADAKDVFGAREPGVRLVVMKDAITGDDVHRDVFGRLAAVGCAVDGGAVVDAATLERAICLGGTVEVTVDTCGNPLDVGREERLFTPRQRLALAVRDGGCRWPACDRPASMTEAHHCTPWAAGGSTDIDDGILLCRFHHIELHFRGWAITSDGRGRFVLAPGAGARRDVGVGAGTEVRGGSRGFDATVPIELRSNSPLRWFWDPPPERPGWRENPAA